MACECGNNEFSASQRCYHDVVVDGENNWVRDEGVSESETPYGPYTCTKCGKIHDELPK
jgi:hypothetical protein